MQRLATIKAGHDNALSEYWDVVVEMKARMDVRCSHNLILYGFH
jgi:hypothetical protein